MSGRVGNRFGGFGFIPNVEILPGRVLPIFGVVLGSPIEPLDSPEPDWVVLGAVPEPAELSDSGGLKVVEGSGVPVLGFGSPVTGLTLSVET